MSIILALKDKFFPKKASVEASEQSGGCPCGDIYKNAMKAAHRNREAQEKDLTKVADEVIHDVCRKMTTGGEFIGHYYVRATIFFRIMETMKIQGLLEVNSLFLSKPRLQFMRKIVQEYFESQGFVVDYEEDLDGRFKFLYISIPEFDQEVES